MSDHGFHVHGAHEHEVEHQAHHGPGLAQYVAIFTAILSTIGAIVSYQGGNTQNEALLYKNEAVLKKAQASDEWNFYQSKSTKAHLMELGMEIATPEKKEFYKQQIAKYDADKKDIKVKAEALEAESRAANDKSEQFMHPHHQLAQSMTLLQISIALASITALTRKRWLFSLAGVAAAGGVLMWVVALLA